MRLRNKETGVIGEVGYISTSTGDILVSNIHDQEEWYHYKSLAELNAEWEDITEEPKDNNYWYIDDFGRIQFSSEILDEVGEHPNNWMARKLFGNYFGTREEAEKAVEKLKAWKRLKDDGITYSLDEGDGTPYIIIHSKEEKGSVQKVLRVLEDLTLLFGGEE